MTTMAPLSMRLTTAGLAAVWAASNTGLDVALSHIALGHGRPGPTPGYAPTGGEVSLWQEFVRAPIGGGQLLDDNHLLVQAMISSPAAFGFAFEMGVFLADGTLFALHAMPTDPITYVSANEALILACTLGLSELPPDSVTWVAGGPSVNIVLAEPIADLGAAIVNLQRAQIQARIDIDALIARAN
jgi:Phage tail-collar fibre protein